MSAIRPGTRGAKRRAVKAAIAARRAAEAITLRTIRAADDRVREVERAMDELRDTIPCFVDADTRLPIRAHRTPAYMPSFRDFDAEPRSLAMEIVDAEGIKLRLDVTDGARIDRAEMVVSGMVARDLYERRDRYAGHDVLREAVHSLYRQLAHKSVIVAALTPPKRKPPEPPEYRPPLGFGMLR